MSQPQPQKQMQIKVPEDVEAGVYANGAGVWHSAHEFTIDFFANLPPTNPNIVPARVVARVKIAPTVIFDLMRALNQNMTKYEDKFGPIPKIELVQKPKDDEGAESDE